METEKIYVFTINADLDVISVHATNDDMAWAKINEMMEKYPELIYVGYLKLIDKKVPYNIHGDWYQK